jgi:hypothetical protein
LRRWFLLSIYPGLDVQGTQEFSDPGLDRPDDDALLQWRQFFLARSLRRFQFQAHLFLDRDEDGMEGSSGASGKWGRPATVSSNANDRWAAKLPSCGRCGWSVHLMFIQYGAFRLPNFASPGLILSPILNVLLCFKTALAAIELSLSSAHCVDEISGQFALARHKTKVL